MTVRSFLKLLQVRMRYPGNDFSVSNNINSNNRFGKGNIIKDCYLNKCTIGNSSRLDNCTIHNSILEDNCAISGGAILFSTKISSHVGIGYGSNIARSNIGSFTYLAGTNFLTDTSIGKFCSIAQGAIIGAAEHPLDRISTSSVFYKPNNETGFAKLSTEEYIEFKPTVIKNDVWIGANASIQSGISIHDGAIIGAGSIVTKDVDPYQIVGGTPARPIRQRFNEEIIQKFLATEWWNWELETLLSLRSFFSRPLSEAFLIELINAKAKL